MRPTTKPSGQGRAFVAETESLQNEKVLLSQSLAVAVMERGFIPPSDRQCRSQPFPLFYQNLRMFFLPAHASYAVRNIQTSGSWQRELLMNL
ncbi:hypothetical protein F2Q69_00010164 [Brassica cretica]|uniref:Uncharacterized protein n=1 Tax=Brassica cretica TaxID=69181 RepID=A0A8S9NPL1_BRACR|nr:hypothetical protein F2Q69_00010164 [Brassica cretica]